MKLFKVFTWGLILVVSAGTAAMGVFCRTPLAWMGIIGLLLVIIGLFALVIAIPVFTSWASKRDIKVETGFHSSRASQWCVAMGLVILAVVAVAIGFSYAAEHWPASRDRHNCCVCRGACYVSW